MIGQNQFTEVIEHLRIQKKLTYQIFLNADETYLIDLKNHLFYEHMLLSKPSSMYNNIITSMTNLLKDDIIKNDLLEALS
jgi:hypothetical protein